MKNYGIGRLVRTLNTSSAPIVLFGAGEYGMFLLIGDWECSCLLKGKDLTEKQRNSNQIATAMILHERGAVTKPLTLEEALWNN